MAANILNYPCTYSEIMNSAKVKKNEFLHNCLTNKYNQS